jgi:hypothetical protein
MQLASLSAHCIYNRDLTDGFNDNAVLLVNTVYLENQNKCDSLIFKIIKAVNFSSEQSTVAIVCMCVRACVRACMYMCVWREREREREREGEREREREGERERERVTVGWREGGGRIYLFGCHVGVQIQNEECFQDRKGF